MLVDNIMTKSVRTCRPHDTLECAVRTMWENDVGIVPVIDDSRHVVGVVTDRDACMAAYTQGKRLQEIPIEAIMSRKVLSVHPEDPIGHAEQVMRDAQVRRIPVVDRTGCLKGILSQNDLVREAARERMVIGKHVTIEEVALTLAAIGRPRHGAQATAAE
jgi:CBS domain-containing protein